MIAVRFYPRESVQKLLAPYGCELVRTLPDGTEIWATGWKEYFTLTPEDVNGDKDWRYDFWQIQQAISNVIVPTMPDSMGGNGSNGSRKPTPH